MKRKIWAKFISGCVVICVILSLSSSLSAKASGTHSVTKLVKKVGNGKIATYMTVTETEVTAVKKPFTSTQARHKKIADTHIAISKGKQQTYSSSASVSATVTANYLAVAMSVNAELGVTESETYTTETTIEYTLTEKTRPGRYRITVVFPCSKVNYYVYHRGGDLEKVEILNKSIVRMPKDGDSYYTLERYAD